MGNRLDESAGGERLSRLSFPEFSGAPPHKAFGKRQSLPAAPDLASTEAGAGSRPSSPPAGYRLRRYFAAFAPILTRFRSPRSKWAARLLLDAAPRPLGRSPQSSTAQASNDNYRTYHDPRRP